MSDAHRERIRTRLERIRQAREFRDRLPDNPAVETQKITANLQRAGQRIESNDFERHLLAALGLIGGQAAAIGRADLAEEVQEYIEEAPVA